MVGRWAEGRVVWGGGVQVSRVLGFGKVWDSVAVAISEEVELGCCGDFWWNWG